MRAILIFTVFALFAVTPIIQAQDGELPPCRPAEFDAVHTSLPEMTAFFHRASTVRTADDLLAYSNAHIEWRESYWSNTPLCAESYEIAMLANQLIGDFVALVLVNSFQVDVEVNPYRAERKNGTVRLQALMDALPPPSDTADQRPAGTPRECSDLEFDVLSYTLVAEYGELADVANLVETVEGFLDYADAHLAWRRDSLTRYPPCVDALEFAWLASQTAGDIAALFAYYFIGAPEDEIPYSEPEREGTRRIGELAEELRAKALPDEVMQAIERELGNPGGGNWRACSASELQTILNIIPEYETLVAMAAGIESIDGLLEYSAEMIQWRERLVSELAHCGEVLEVAWIMSEYLGDLAAINAHGFLNIPFDESPVFQQVMSNMGGVQTWSIILDDLVNQRESEPEAKPGSGDLPGCTASELDTINSILADHYALYDAAGVVETLEEYLAFTEAQLAWREANWARLPLCGDSFEYFLRMNWTNNDTTIGGVLHFFADVAYNDNPYWPAVGSFKERADILLNRLRGINANQ